ncbi:hypothetical protein KCU65_g174, partial [Aureobasidium melanogenum]
LCQWLVESNVRLPSFKTIKSDIDYSHEQRLPARKPLSSLQKALCSRTTTSSQLSSPNSRYCILQISRYCIMLKESFLETL